MLSTLITVIVFIILFTIHTYNKSYYQIIYHMKYVKYISDILYPIISYGIWIAIVITIFHFYIISRYNKLFYQFILIILLSIISAIILCIKQYNVLSLKSLLVGVITYFIIYVFTCGLFSILLFIVHRNNQKEVK